MTTIEDKYYYKYLKYKKKYLQLLYELYGSGKSKSKKRIYNHTKGSIKPKKGYIDLTKSIKRRQKIANEKLADEAEKAIFDRTLDYALKIGIPSDACAKPSKISDAMADILKPYLPPNLEWPKPNNPHKLSELVKIYREYKSISKKSETYEMVIFIVAHGELLDIHQSQHLPESTVMIKSLPTQTMIDGNLVYGIIDDVRSHLEKKDGLNKSDIDTLHRIQQQAYNQYNSFKGKIYNEGDMYTDVNISTREQTDFNIHGMAFVFLIPYKGVIKDMEGEIMRVTLDGVKVTLNGYEIVYNEGEKTPSGKPKIYLINNDGSKMLVEPFILDFIEFNKWVRNIKTMAHDVIDPRTQQLKLIYEKLSLSSILGILKTSFPKFILMLHACSSLPTIDKKLETDKKIADVYGKIEESYRGNISDYCDKTNACNSKFAAMLRANGLYNKYLKQI
jgi:hypothetical protein